MICRTGKDFSGPWGAPAMYALEGGSFGLQLGAESTDVVVGAKPGLHSPRRGNEDRVAGGVPVGIVHFLEEVEIDHRQRQRAVIARGTRQLPVEELQ